MTGRLSSPLNIIWTIADVQTICPLRTQANEICIDSHFHSKKYFENVSCKMVTLLLGPDVFQSIHTVTNALAIL